MSSVRVFVRRWPRAAAAIAFGLAALVVIHFSWYPEARLNGIAPALTIGVGLAHAVAGALAGRRLGDRVRTPEPSHAILTGAVTSLLALLMFTPFFGAFVSASDAQRESVFSYLVLTMFTGVFTFLGAWWVLVPVSAGVAWGLYLLAGETT